MGILSWIVIGLLAGVIAKFLMPGSDPGGWIITILLGIVGAIVGGFVMGLFGYGGVTGINIWSIIVATLGAVILLFVARALRRGPSSERSHTRHPADCNPYEDEGGRNRSWAARSKRLYLARHAAPCAST